VRQDPFQKLPYKCSTCTAGCDYKYAALYLCNKYSWMLSLTSERGRRAHIWQSGTSLLGWHPGAANTDTGDKRCEKFWQHNACNLQYLLYVMLFRVSMTPN